MTDSDQNRDQHARAMTARKIELVVWDHQRELIGALVGAAARSHGNQPVSEDWFRWKFSESPYGPSIVVIGLAGDEIAGMVAFGRQEVLLGNSVLSAALSYETFVVPEFRGEGLFSRLLEEAMREMRRSGVEVAFNFPNAASLRGFVKQGWQQIDSVPLLVKPTNAIRMARWGSHLLRRQRFIPTRGTSDNSIALPPRLRNPSPLPSARALTPHRTAEYLRWRLSARSGLDYRVYDVGDCAAVVRVGQRGKLREAQLLDLVADAAGDHTAIQRMVKTIKDSVRPDFMSYRCSKGHPLWEWLRLCGFVTLPNRSNCTVVAIDPRFDAYMAPEGWVFSTLDFHTY